MSGRVKPRDDFKCSFCGAERRKVRVLIAGPAVYICDGCIKTCVDVLVSARAGGNRKMKGRENRYRRWTKPLSERRE